MLKLTWLSHASWLIETDENRILLDPFFGDNPAAKSTIDDHRDISHILDFRVADDFHVYGFEWDPDYLSIYLDGALVKCMSRVALGDRWVATAPHRIWIDSEIFDWEVSPDELSEDDFGADGVDFIVDYARVFKRKNDKAGAGCPVQTNLLENGDFEKGNEGWNDVGVVTSNSFNGQNALRLSGPARLSKTVSVEPNTRYLLSAAVSSTHTNMKDKWANGYLGVLEKGKRLNDVRFFLPDWKEGSLQFKTGVNTRQITIYFTNAPQGGTMLIDDILLTKMSSP